MADDRDDDLDWLYRRTGDGAREPAGAEPTAVLRPDEVAGLNAADQQAHGRAARGPGRGSHTAAPPQAPPLRPTARPSSGQPPRPPQPPGRAESRRTRRHPIRRTVLVLLIAWLVFMIGTPVYAFFIANRVDASPAGKRPAEQPGTAILLVGSDSREGLTDEQRRRLGTGSTQGRRTDSMMILYSPPSGRPVLLSLPRDSYVPIPGHGRNKLNAAYAFGGPTLLVQTVENNTGIRMDGYMEVGFLGIVDSVDALGGVEVCLNKPIKDRDAHLDLPAGCQTLDGRNALGYVRMRKSDPTGDIGRMKRQREMIGKIVKKAASPTSWLNPVTYWRLNMAAGQSLTMGTDDGVGEVTTAAAAFMRTASGNGVTLTVPLRKENARTKGGASIMLWDEARSNELFAMIIAGDTDDLDKFVK